MLDLSLWPRSEKLNKKCFLPKKKKKTIVWVWMIGKLSSIVGGDKPTTG